MHTEKKVTAVDVPDADIAKLVNTLDDGGDGELSIQEIGEFIERGPEIFLEREHAMAGAIFFSAAPFL